MTHSRFIMMGLGFLFIATLGVIMLVPNRVLAVAATQLSNLTAPENGHTSDQNNAGANQVNQPQQTSSASNDVNNTGQQDSSLSCPRQTELYKKDQFWYGPNSWRDFSPSFAVHISNFAGAQWIGVNVGKIICLYKGLEGNDFPIALERDNLMKKPSGEHWKADSSGYQICKSDNVLDCPFTPEEKESKENIYDFLQNIKK